MGLGGGGVRVLNALASCLSEKTKNALLNNFLSKGVARYVRRFFTEYSNEEPCRRRFPNFRPARPPETETAQFCDWLIELRSLLFNSSSQRFRTNKKNDGRDGVLKPNPLHRHRRGLEAEVRADTRVQTHG